MSNSCDPMDCSLLSSSDQRIVQARILECAAISFSRGIFPTQESNPSFLHCRQIHYQLSYEGSLLLLLTALEGKYLPPIKWSNPKHRDFKWLIQGHKLVNGRTMIFIPSISFFSLSFRQLPQNSRIQPTGPLTWPRAKRLTIQLESVTFRLKAKIFAYFCFLTIKWIYKSFLRWSYICI